MGGILCTADRCCRLNNELLEAAPAAVSRVEIFFGSDDCGARSGNASEGISGGKVVSVEASVLK